MLGKYSYILPADDTEFIRFDITKLHRNNKTGSKYRVPVNIYTSIYVPYLLWPVKFGKSWRISKQIGKAEDIEKTTLKAEDLPCYRKTWPVCSCVVFFGLPTGAVRSNTNLVHTFTQSQTCQVSRNIRESPEMVHDIQASQQCYKISRNVGNRLFFCKESCFWCESERVLVWFIREILITGTWNLRCQNDHCVGITLA